MQTESRDTSLLVIYAEVQLILCKDTIYSSILQYLKMMCFSVYEYDALQFINLKNVGFLLLKIKFILLLHPFLTDLRF